MHAGTFYLFVEGVLGTVALIIYSFMGSGVHDMDPVGYGLIALSGVCAYVSLLLVFTSLQHGVTGVVFAIFNSNAVLQTMFSSLVLGQEISKLQVVGVILAWISLVTLALNDKIKDLVQMCFK